MAQRATYCSYGAGCEPCWGWECDGFKFMPVESQTKHKVLALPAPKSTKPPPIVTQITSKVKYRELK